MSIMNFHLEIDPWFADGTQGSILKTLRRYLRVNLRRNVDKLACFTTQIVTMKMFEVASLVKKFCYTWSREVI